MVKSPGMSPEGRVLPGQHVQLQPFEGVLTMRAYVLPPVTANGGEAEARLKVFHRLPDACQVCENVAVASCAGSRLSSAPVDSYSENVTV